MAAKRLIEEWVINYPLQLRPAVLRQRFAAPIINWWGNAHLEKYNAMWGGEIAGEILADYRKPGRSSGSSCGGFSPWNFREQNS